MKYKIESQKADPVRERTGSAFFCAKIRERSIRRNDG